MQHRRPRLMAKILAFVLAVSLVFPVSAFASVADLADDTRTPGKSLANTYPNLPVDWQVSLAEDTKDVTVKVHSAAFGAYNRKCNTEKRHCANKTL